MAPQKTVFWEVDAQADFMLPGGKLYVPGAEKIIPNIERLVAAAIEAGALLVSSGDSHPEGDPEFERFPPHCLRGTSGARIVPEGLAANFCTIPNDASRAMPSHVLSFPQVVFEKQTLDVFDNPHASELVERLPGRCGIRGLWRGDGILREMRGEGIARTPSQGCDREGRDRSARSGSRPPRAGRIASPRRAADFDR